MLACQAIASGELACRAVALAKAGGTAEAGELREDVPDPVAGFASPANLRQRGVVAGGGTGLGLMKAGEGVGQRLKS
jgi:hypothetical protein